MCTVLENECLHVQLVAVAARSLERAKEFAKRHGVKSAYGSYESLAQDPDVGWYISTSIILQNMKRFDWRHNVLC